MLSKSLGNVPPEQTFQKIVAGQLKFGVWGTVTYTDALKDKHKENFEYVWIATFRTLACSPQLSTSGE